MWCIGWDHMYTAGGKKHFFSSYDHLQLAFEDIGDLLMNVMMFLQPAAFADVPYRQRAGVPMQQLAKKAGSDLLDRDIAQVLHLLFFQNYAKSISPPSTQCGKVDKLL